MTLRSGHRNNTTSRGRPVERDKRRARSGAPTAWLLIALCLGFVWTGVALAVSASDLKINRVNAGPVGGKVDAFVTVTTESGAPVAGLTAESFRVQLGGGSPAAPTQTSPPSEQLSVVFVMDFTTTVRESSGLKALQDATEGFVKQMQPNDWAAIVKYNIEPSGASVVSPFEPLVTPLDEQTGKSALYDIIYADYPGGGTNLNQALRVALDHIAEKRPLLPAGRTAIVLLADGEDNYFEFTGRQPEPGETAAAVRDLANELNVPIFTIGVAEVLTGGDGTWLQRMQALAADTGGQFFDATEDAEAAITEAFATTANLLTTEYQITFDGVNNCDRQVFTVSVPSLGLSADGFFTHRGCSTSGGGGSSGGGGAFGPLGLIAGLSLLALLRLRRSS